jgi:endonuclease YncB( thermonuclease family)
MAVRPRVMQGGRLGTWLLAVTTALLLAAPAAAAANERACVVIGVDDAATWRLQCGGEVRTLQLASVRAPRPGTPLQGGEPYGTQGRDLVRGWFVGRRVEMGGGTVRLGGEDVRHGLLFLGLVEWTGTATTAGDAALQSAAREARLGSRGLWSHAAWRRHQASVREPLLVPGVPPLPAQESIGARAARFQRKSAAERRAAFEAAIGQIEAYRGEAPPLQPSPRPRKARQAGQ